ncbi:MAG: hypothetical protein JOZ18_14010, partial [Chloroflexi bacterium]|nr:hypothetical protein [Chloroflexota bacterium]
MRFERGFGGEKSGIFIQTWDHETFTNVSGLGRHLTTAGSVELRIQRQGDQFTASWRVTRSDLANRRRNGPSFRASSGRRRPDR